MKNLHSTYYPQPYGLVKSTIDLTKSYPTDDKGLLLDDGKGDIE